MKESTIDALIAESLAIEVEDAKDAGTIGYMARAMVQATMPHKRTTDTAHERVNGNFHLTMLAPPSIGLPYGSVPRLMLAWIGAEVVRTRQREITLGDSMSEFMRELGMAPTGGRWGTVTRLKDQSKRLFGCTISTHYSDEAEVFANAAPFHIGKAELWWNAQIADQLGLFRSTLTLSDAFYQEITEHSVPVDMRVLKMLRRSPLALDVYAWVSYRVFTLNRSRRDSALIPWGALQMQFGSSYPTTTRGTLDFKANFTKALVKVNALAYQNLRCSCDRTGLTLHRSPQHLPSRGPKLDHQKKSD